MSDIQSNAEIIERFLDLLNTATADYETNNEAMRKEDMKTQDYLHQLEFISLKYHEKCKVTTELIQIRKDRRVYKDAIQELQPIVEFVDDPKNKPFVNRLKTLLGEVRKAEKYHSNRVYMPRVIDMEPITENEMIKVIIS